MAAPILLTIAVWKGSARITEPTSLFMTTLCSMVSSASGSRVTVNPPVPESTTPETVVPRTPIVADGVRTNIISGESEDARAFNSPVTNEKDPLTIETPQEPSFVPGSKTNSSRTKLVSLPRLNLVLSKNSITTDVSAPVSMESP